jgi:outer membrane protein TolC
LTACLAPAVAADVARPTMPGEPVALDGVEVALRLADAVFIGLANNGAIRSAYLERAAQKQELKQASDIFSPRFSVSSRHVANQTEGDDYFSLTEIKPTATLQSEYGTKFSLSYDNRITQGGLVGYNRNDGASFTVVQPLLRGASREVVTAPLRKAEMTDQMNRLKLKAAVANAVTEIVVAYNDLLRAQEQERLARQAVTQANRLLFDNLHLIAAGFYHDVDFVLAEAEVAQQELASEEAVNQLEACRLHLLRLLALDLELNVRAVDAIDAHRVKVSVAQALRAAREQQPAWLIQNIAFERARVDLTVARDQRKWDVSLVGGARQSRNYAHAANGGHDTTTDRENHAGIQIEIPIGDAGPRESEARASINVRNENTRLIEARQALERDINDAVRTLDTRWRQVEIAQRAQDLARRKLENERERQRTGSSASRLPAFESALRDAEATRINAIVAYRNAQATLERIQGTTLDSWEISLND